MDGSGQDRLAVPAAPVLPDGGSGPAPQCPARGGGQAHSRRSFVQATVGTLAAAAVAEPVLRPWAASGATRPVPAHRAPAAAADAAAAGAARARALFRQLDEKIAAGMAKYVIPGASVGVRYLGHEHVRGFGVTDVRYPVPVDGNTLFRIGSTSKTFTGTAVMRLVEAGRLNLDGQVTRYLPGFRAPGGAQTVTVRQLLNHSAGWLGDDFYDTGRGWDALPKYVARMQGLPQLTPPGSVFAYNNAAITLAGRLIEQATGTTYEYAMRDLLLRPLGLAHTFYFSDEVIGYNVAAPHFAVNGRAVVDPRAWQVPRSINAAGGLASSAADQLRYARFHLGDGRAPDGTRLLPESSLDAMRSHPGPGGTMVVELTGMGVTWMLRPSAQGTRIVQHGGHWPGQVSGFLMVPGQGFALTLLTNCESGSSLVNELFADDWALRLFTGLTNLPAVERRLSAAELGPYLGRYALQQLDFAGRLVGEPPGTVTAHDGSLLLTSGAGAAASRTILTFYSSPFGPDYVLVKEGNGTPRGTRANFLRDQAGRIRWLRLGGRLHKHQI